MEAAQAPMSGAAALSLINDADFVARYMAGDSAARAQWDAASIDNATVAQAAEGSSNA
jgi:hypothetical protein